MLSICLQIKFIPKRTVEIFLLERKCLYLKKMKSVESEKALIA